jgi:prevent-host-death family protein
LVIILTIREVPAMKTVPLSEAKAKLSRLLDAVERRDEEIVITRNGRAVAVLVNPEDLASWKETAAIRADADLVAEIRLGLSALRRGKAKIYTLDELFAD